MSIYIFEPAGSGGSQNLQQVLTTGSTLTVNNTITINDTFYLNFDLLGQNLIKIGTNATQGNFEFFGGQSDDNVTFIGYGVSGAQGIYIDNKLSVWKFGEFNAGTGSIVYEPSILNKLVLSCSVAIRQNSPTLEFATDSLVFYSQSPNALTSATAGGSSGLHLIVEIDGNPYKINLLNP